MLDRQPRHAAKRRPRVAPLLTLLPAVAANHGHEHQPLRRWQARFLDEYPLALCNDGSPAAYYYRPGLGWSPRRWLVFLEGGGWCWDQATCSSGWAKRHSSSKSWPRTEEEVEKWSRRLTTGIFNNVHSPLADARIAYVRQCSNDAYMGDASPPHALLHFRGRHIIDAVFRDLRFRTGLGERKGDLLVYAGCSSGARGAMVSLDYVATELAGQADVVGVLDSALWVPVPPLGPSASFEMQTRGVLEHANATGFISQACRESYPEHLWKCLFGAYRLPLITTPYLLSQSQYDNFAISTSVHGFYDPRPDLGPPGLRWAETYRRKVLEFLPKPANGSGTAVFSTACYLHCTISHPAAMTFRAAGTSLPELLENWLAAPSPTAATADFREDCEGFNCGSRNAMNWRRERLAAERGLREGGLPEVA